MPPNSNRWKWFFAFSAVFAGLAGFVFWGTWSLDVAPVMPDSPITYPADYLFRNLCALFKFGKFVPGDIINFLGSPYFWQELKYVIALYCAALGMAYYARGRGFSYLSAYGSGLLLAFSGYWLTLFSAGHFGWFQWMTYGVFAFGLIDRALCLGRIRHWLMLGAVVAWASFNQQDLWLLFTALTAAYFVWACAREHRLPWKGALISLAVFIVIGVPNFRETFGSTIKGREAQIGTDTPDGRWEFVTNWSMPLEDTEEFFNARVQGDTSCPFVLSINHAAGVRPYTGALGRNIHAQQGNYRQHSLYVGWVTCILAILGLVLGLTARKYEVLFFLVAGMICYAFSLGRYFESAYRLIFALPAGDMIRCPVKWHHLTELCIVVLAAHGIEGILRLNVRRQLALRFGLALFVLWGAIDLARNAKLYCAPVSIAYARARNLETSLTVMNVGGTLPRNILCLARYYGPNYRAYPSLYVVEAMRPFSSEKPELPALPLTGALSIFTSIAVVAFSLTASIAEYRRTRPKNLI